jgi:hypothetical protein
MNDARRKEIQRALTLVGEAKDILEVALTQEQGDFDNMPEDPRRRRGTKRDKERRTWLTHWSVPRWAAAMRLPPARRRYRASRKIADEMREEHRSRVLIRRYAFRNSSGSLAIFTAFRRAALRVNNLARDRRPIPSP